MDDPQEDSCSGRFPLWLRMSKPKRKRRKTKRHSQDVLSESDLSEFIPSGRNLSLYCMIVETIRNLLAAKERSLDQLIRAAIHAVRSREEMMDLFNYRFDDKFDEENAISQVLFNALAVLESLGVVSPVKLNEDLNILGPDEHFVGIPGYVLNAEHYSTVLENVDDYVTTVVNLRQRAIELKKTEEKLLSEYVEKIPLDVEVEMTISNDNKTKRKTKKREGVFLPGRPGVLASEVIDVLKERMRANRSHAKSIIVKPMEDYSGKLKDILKLRQDVVSIHKKLTPTYKKQSSSSKQNTTTQHSSASNAPNIKKNKKNKNRRTVCHSFKNFPTIQTPEIVFDKNTIVTQQVDFKEISQQFKLLGSEMYSPRPTAAPTLGHTISSMSLISQVDVPSFRLYDWKLDLNKGQNSTEEKNAAEKNTIQQDVIEKNTIQKNTIQEDNAIQDDAIKNTIQNNTIQKKTIQENAIPDNTILENTIQENTIREAESADDEEDISDIVMLERHREALAAWKKKWELAMSAKSRNKQQARDRKNNNPRSPRTSREQTPVVPPVQALPTVDAQPQPQEVTKAEAVDAEDAKINVEDKNKSEEEKANKEQIQSDEVKLEPVEDLQEQEEKKTLNNTRSSNRIRKRKAEHKSQESGITELKKEPEVKKEPVQKKAKVEEKPVRRSNRSRRKKRRS